MNLSIIIIKLYCKLIRFVETHLSNVGSIRVFVFQGSHFILIGAISHVMVMVFSSIWLCTLNFYWIHAFYHSPKCFDWKKWKHDKLRFQNLGSQTLWGKYWVSVPYKKKFVEEGDDWKEWERQNNRWGKGDLQSKIKKKKNIEKNNKKGMTPI